MPCRDYQDCSGPVYVDRPETVRKLCDALTALERAGVPIPSSCLSWWAAHKKEDSIRREAEKARLNKEQKREEILKKLSKEEKKILGL